MDWERFKRVLESSSRDPIQVLSDERPFFVKFLSSLLEALEHCPDSRACVSMYPKAGPLLTAAATHPTLATDPSIARLLIACLFEFAKLQNALPNQELSKQEKSIAWCIQRVRRLQYASCQDPAGLDSTSRKIEMIQVEVEDKMKHADLTTSQVTRLLQVVLLLVRHDSAAPLIQTLVGISLDLMDMQRDDGDETNGIIVPSFPETFETHLLGDNDGLWRLYLTWPSLLKARLWTYFDDIPRKEIYTLLMKYAPQSVSFEEISMQIKRTSFLQTLCREPWVLQHVLRLISETIFVSSDWRVYRIWWHTFRTLELYKCQLPNGLDRVVSLLMQTDAIPQTCCQLQAALSQYIYCGAFDQITNRRRNAWFLAMLHLDFLQRCLYALLCDYVSGSNAIFTWTTETESICRYIAWACCPSDDDRLDAVMEQLYQWFYGLISLRPKTQARKTIGYIASSYVDVFNDNIAIGLSAALNILKICQNWGLDDQKAMLDAVLNIHTRDTSSSINRCVVDRSAAFLLVQDLLPSMCSSLTNIHLLVQYVKISDS